jgi:hypothetical protein
VSACGSCRRAGARVLEVRGSKPKEHGHGQAEPGGEACSTTRMDNRGVGQFQDALPRLPQMGKSGCSIMIPPCAVDRAVRVAPPPQSRCPPTQPPAGRRDHGCGRRRDWYPARATQRKCHEMRCLGGQLFLFIYLTIGFSMLGATLSEVERVCKRHRASHAARINHVDSLIALLQEARNEADTSEMVTDSTDAMEVDGATKEKDPNLRATLTLLVQKSKQIEKDLAADSKDLQNAISKSIKTVDKSLPPDFSKSMVPISFDNALIEDMILDHFLRGGRTDLAKILAKEAGKQIGPETYEPFVQLTAVYDGFKERDLDPALAWISSNSDALRAASSSFPFQVVKMKFLQLAQISVIEAIGFSRQHFPKFASTNLHDIQKLMGSLAFIKRLDGSPYKEFLDVSMWDNLADLFIRDSCRLLGLSEEMPLLVCVKAGALALPKLLKLVTVMGKNADWTLKTAPPLDVDLGSSFYHSVFVCPVSREVASAENPPMMMQCGHVLCEHSLRKLSRGSSRFKCPYCPAEVTVQGSMRLSL